MTRPIRITTGVSRLSRRLQRKKVSWAKLANRLQQYETIDHTYDEYRKLPVDQQAALKDVGFLVGGWFRGPKRLQAEMARRSIITLDIDHIDPYDLDEICDTYEDYAYAVHSTAKHSEDTPRLRLVLPLEKDCKPAEYEPIARKVASWLGMDAFDDTTFQPARIMYWPAVTIDGAIWKRINNGRFIDGKEILESYEDWTDFGEWPHSSRISKMRRPVKQAEDPLSKAGVVGAFCRNFDIHAAITEFELPYEATEFDNRYSPEGSSGSAGAIVYDDVFLYSHHESDVAAQQNLNAFDLVRLHRFHELAAKESDDDSMGERASYRAMSQLAVSFPAVVQELHAPLIDEMEAHGSGEATAAVEPEDKADADALLTFKDLRRELNTIQDLEDPEPACDQMIPKIAAAKLGKTDTTRLAGMLRNLYPDPKPPKQAIIDDIKETGKRLTGHLATEGVIVDAERRVIQYAFDENFDGGNTIKRFSKLYWTYDRGLWSIDNDERIDGMLANTIIKLREERPQDLAELVATIDDRNTSGWLASLAKVIKGVLAAREDKNDPLRLKRTYPEPVINTLNCEIYIKRDGTIKTKKHDPNNFFTTRIECKYKPKAKCPEWDRFCELIFAGSSDPEDMTRHLEELCGYAISMSRWLKTWVLFHGPKDTGKSTVAEVLKRMMGDAYLGYDLGRFSNIKSNQFTENALVGKLVLVDDDFEKNSMLPDGFLKKISEEKSMSSEEKWGDVFQFVCRALPIICSNHWPKSKDLTDALRERALVFPFHHKIAGRDRDDARRNAMLDEMPGMLNKFLAGICRLRERGDWDVPLDCAEARDEWVAHSNMVALFLKHSVERADEDLKTTDVWQAFELWNRTEIGHGNQKTVGRNSFYDHLDSLLGVRVGAHGSTMVYRGWRLKQNPLVEEMDDAASDTDDWDDDD